MFSHLQVAYASELWNLFHSGFRHLIKIPGSGAFDRRKETLFQRPALRHDGVNFGLVLAQIIDQAIQLRMILHRHLEMAVLQTEFGKFFHSFALAGSASAEVSMR